MEYIVSLVNLVDALGTMMLKIESIEDDTLTQLQREVGGYVDVANWIFPDLTEEGFDCWIADDGFGKPITLIHERDGHQYPVRGNLVFALHDDEGNTIGMDKMDCLYLVMKLNEVSDRSIPVKLSVDSKEEAFEWDKLISAAEEVMAQA